MLRIELVALYFLIDTNPLRYITGRRDVCISLEQPSLTEAEKDLAKALYKVRKLSTSGYGPDVHWEKVPKTIRISHAVQHYLYSLIMKDMPDSKEYEYTPVVGLLAGISQRKKIQDHAAVENVSGDQTEKE